MIQEEITKALNHDNADDVWDEIFPLDLDPDLDIKGIRLAYLVPNLPTLEEALLAILDVNLIGKSEQWLWVAITEQHKEFDTIINYLIEANMFPFMDYGYSFNEILTKYNNNPINFKSL